MCVVSHCCHWDGVVGEPNSNRIRIPCESCAGPMSTGIKTVEFGRICSRCVAEVERDRERRQQQRSIGVPRSWLL